MKAKEFNPERLKLARQCRGLTIKELSSKAGISTRSLSAFENSQKEPSYETVKKLAYALNFPEDFFFKDDPPNIRLEAVSFQALSRLFASLRNRFISAAKMAIEINEWIETKLMLPEPDIPDLSNMDPETAAQVLRDQWGLGQKPISRVIPLVEAKGVRVFSIPERHYDIDAFSFWRNERPFIFLNTNRSVERIRFDVAHELGHLVLHKHEQPRGKSPESEAHRFASAFLMPAGSIISIADESRFYTLDHFLKLKLIWGVSVAAIIRRFHDLGIITDWRYRTLNIELAKKGYFKNEPNPVSYHELSLLWPKALKILKEMGISKFKLAQALSFNPKDIESLFRNLMLTRIK